MNRHAGLRAQGLGLVLLAATACAPAPLTDKTPKAGGEMSRAVQLASTSEIDRAREKFGDLSDAIDTYMTGLKLRAPEGVKVAFCPMVHKPWLQTASTIDNPYFGKSMLTCGSFR